MGADATVLLKKDGKAVHRMAKPEDLPVAVKKVNRTDVDSVDFLYTGRGSPLSVIEKPSSPVRGFFISGVRYTDNAAPLSIREEMQKR
jgi:hypothetical protein